MRQSHAVLPLHPPPSMSTKASVSICSPAASSPPTIQGPARGNLSEGWKQLKCKGLSTDCNLAASWPFGLHASCQSFDKSCSKADAELLLLTIPLSFSITSSRPPLNVCFLFQVATFSSHLNDRPIIFDFMHIMEARASSLSSQEFHQGCMNYQP